MTNRFIKNYFNTYNISDNSNQNKSSSSGSSSSNNYYDNNINEINKIIIIHGKDLKVTLIQK